MNDLPLNLDQQQRALEWAIELAATAQEAKSSLLPDHAPRRLPEPARTPLPPPEAGVYHLLYCSQASQAFGEEQLADLLEYSLTHNGQCGITGLLCYGSGHFVQMLEGPALAVENLFARIARDRRHHQVRVLSRGLGPARRFADWRMAFAKANSQEFYWLITFLEANHHRLLLRQKPIAEPALATRLLRFSNACPRSHQPLASH